MANGKSTINPQDLQSMAPTSGAGPQLPHLRELLDEAQRVTAWARAESMFALLKDISDHCRRTANELERNLMALEGMLGKMPKKS